MRKRTTTRGAPSSPLSSYSAAQRSLPGLYHRREEPLIAAEEQRGAASGASSLLAGDRRRRRGDDLPAPSLARPHVQTVMRLASTLVPWVMRVVSASRKVTL